MKRRPRRRAPPGGPLFAAEAANDVWTIDFKGWFRTGDGTRIDPLTLSRRLQPLPPALPGGGAARHRPRLADPRRRLPRVRPALRLRSDNGPPFATTGAGGLSRLAVRVLKAGVTPERIRPGKPQENGRHERMHLTLLRDTADPPAATPRAQQARFRDFRASYNEERPHAALGNATPAEHYLPSFRRWDGILRSPEPDAGAIVRRVRCNGDIKWRGEVIYLSEALTGEPVALADTDDGRWAVHYGPVLLGFIAHRGDRLVRPKGPMDLWTTQSVAHKLHSPRNTAATAT